MKELSFFRKKLEKIDFGIIELFGERKKFSADVGLIKVVKKLPIYDPAQEKRVIASRYEFAKKYGLTLEEVKAIMEVLMESSKKIQKEVMIQQYIN